MVLTINNDNSERKSLPLKFLHVYRCHLDRGNYSRSTFSHMGVTYIISGIWDREILLLSLLLSIFSLLLLLLAHLSRRLTRWAYRMGLEPASVRPSMRASVHTFKHEYLRDQQADYNQILSEASLMWRKGCNRFWCRSDDRASTNFQILEVWNFLPLKFGGSTENFRKFQFATRFYRNSSICILLCLCFFLDIFNRTFMSLLWLWLSWVSSLFCFNNFHRRVGCFASVLLVFFLFYFFFSFKLSSLH